MQGHEKISSKYGACFSLLLYTILVYSVLLSSTQIMSHERFSKSEKLEYGDAVGVHLDFTEQAANLAFRATDVKRKEVNVDPKIASWKARIVRVAHGNTLDETFEEYIPIKYCDQQNYSDFAPSRAGQENIIDI